MIFKYFFFTIAVLFPFIHTGTAGDLFIDSIMKVDGGTFIESFLKLLDSVCRDHHDIHKFACKSCQCLEGLFKFQCSSALGCSAPTAVKQLHKDPKDKDSDEDGCLPQEFFHYYCNTCACSADGQNIACTVKSCPPNMFNHDGSLRKNFLSIENEAIENISNMFPSIKQKLMKIPIKV